MVTIRHSATILRVLIKWIDMSPKGMNHALCFQGPGYATMKIRKTAKSESPLHGSPIHSKLPPSTPIVRICSAFTGSGISVKPNPTRMVLDNAIRLSIKALSRVPSGCIQSSNAKNQPVNRIAQTVRNLNRGSSLNRCNMNLERENP